MILLSWIGGAFTPVVLFSVAVANADRSGGTAEFALPNGSKIAYTATATGDASKSRWNGAYSESESATPLHEALELAFAPAANVESAEQVTGSSSGSNDGGEWTLHGFRRGGILAISYIGSNRPAGIGASIVRFDASSDDYVGFYIGTNDQDAIELCPYVLSKAHKFDAIVSVHAEHLKTPCVAMEGDE